jgi:hypothetical protein
MDGLEKLRRGARRLVLELCGMAMLALVAITLPLDRTPVTGWSLMAPYLALVTHMLVGLLVLGDAALLVVRCAATAMDTQVFLPAVGVAATIVSVGSGATLLAGAPLGDVRIAMTVGWLVGLVAYAVAWRRSSTAVRKMRALVGESPSAGRRDRFLAGH